MKCKVCGSEAVVSLKSHNAAFCGGCYLMFFRRQLEKGITQANLFSRSEPVLVALSGGKDSLSLILELQELGYNVTGLFIDLGIPDSSHMARNIVEEFCNRNSLVLKVVDLEAEGLPIPLVKKYLKRPVCSACGKIKRYFFNRVALENGFSVLATGHNLDDEVARLFSNTLRWDTQYLSDQGPCLECEAGFVRKVKPLWRISEFETANYAFLRGIHYHLPACPYSGNATFSSLKGVMQKLESIMPGKKIDFYQGFLAHARPIFAACTPDKNCTLSPCVLCGAPTSSQICGVCRIRLAIKENEDK